MISNVVDTAILSETGPRSENEDSTLAVSFGSSSTLIAVADGLGGHEGGKIASRCAVDTLLERVRTTGGRHFLKDILLNIHSDLRTLQEESSNVRGMATTLSAAVIEPPRMSFVHCGDTRIAVARGDGIKRLTVDHSEAQRLFDAGKLSREQLAAYPRKNILDSALGIQGTPKIDEGEFSLRPGDKIFITSDGLHTKILLRELLAISKKCSSAQSLVDEIGREMSSRRAEDNYSLVCAIIS